VEKVYRGRCFVGVFFLAMSITLRCVLTPSSASIVPIVKALFRRPDDEKEESNSTEYAFRKSKSLVSRILASATRPGLGTITFFVFVVLYVFSNEVTLRAARKLSKRLKRLNARVEDGRDLLTEDDVKVLKGWRWRVLEWSE